jgi:hypothetical protein
LRGRVFPNLANSEPPKSMLGSITVRTVKDAGPSRKGVGVWSTRQSSEVRTDRTVPFSCVGMGDACGRWHPMPSLH